ncbi:hypothetical protein ACIQ1D_19420 [Lysinibacillus xylanilyticus]|uniref:hypothetical protein n=1 Tax=Lysinibacillus xylanilyticus TaxID=582475 RepID=UPI0037FFB871
MIAKQDYIAYMHSLKGSIFKILPLYEEGVETLPEHIKSVIFEVHNVNKITSDYDGAWLVQTHAILNGLLDECLKEDNKPLIRSKVFGTIDNIEKQLFIMEQE